MWLLLLGGNLAFESVVAPGSPVLDTANTVVKQEGVVTKPQAPPKRAFGCVVFGAVPVVFFLFAFFFEVVWPPAVV